MIGVVTSLAVILIYIMYCDYLDAREGFLPESEKVDVVKERTPSVFYPTPYGCFEVPALYARGVFMSSLEDVCKVQTMWSNMFITCERAAFGEGYCRIENDGGVIKLVEVLELGCRINNYDYEHCNYFTKSTAERYKDKFKLLCELVMKESKGSIYT